MHTTIKESWLYNVGTENLRLETFGISSSFNCDEGAALWKINTLSSAYLAIWSIFCWSRTESAFIQEKFPVIWPGFWICVFFLITQPSLCLFWHVCICFFSTGMMSYLRLSLRSLVSTGESFWPCTTLTKRMIIARGLVTPVSAILLFWSFASETSPYMQT